jgi:hypothetical protein
MRVVHTVRKVLGTLLAVLCLASAVYGLLKLAQFGSCASGGNYVSTRQCSPQTGMWNFMLGGGIVGCLLAIGLGYTRNTAAYRRGNVSGSAPTAAYVASVAHTMLPLPGGSGGPERPAGWPASVPGPPVVSGEPAAAWQAQSDGRLPWGAQAAPAAKPDPLVRLERLQALRDSGALSAAEFDRAKAKVLNEL